jgi:hypothetical protein
MSSFNSTLNPARIGPLKRRHPSREDNLSRLYSKPWRTNKRQKKKLSFCSIKKSKYCLLLAQDRVNRGKFNSSSCNTDLITDNSETSLSSHAGKRPRATYSICCNLGLLLKRNFILSILAKGPLQHNQLAVI